MRQWTVDAFAAQPFRGNPACVLEPMDAWPDAGSAPSASARPAGGSTWRGGWLGKSIS